MTETLFDRAEDGSWVPLAFARGPFDGMQGGAVAALMCAAAEEIYPIGFVTLGIDARFLRPCPLEPIAVDARIVHAGSRLVVAEVSLSANGKTRATATVSAAKPVAIPAIVLPPAEAHDPASGTTRPAPVTHGKPWLMDRMDARLSSAGVPWFRFPLRITGSESAFARALCPADWLPGLTRADSWDKPVVRAAPNVDLSVRMHRHPVGEWIGVRAKGRWSPDGNGVAGGDLLDVTGPVGFVSCALALVP
jgi:acyl-CoA thioesterase